jgi:hypothetical protein
MNDLLSPLPVPIAEQVAEIKREIALRQRVYPRWVGLGKLTQRAADRQIAVMQAVLAKLQEAP